ncbi:MAG TPA: cyclase family protein [Burkholderiales bacterium]|jgi:kynurenine formamidase|nr:cyclase family protein [Burkholderiales bacterium]
MRWKQRPQGSNWGDFGADDQLGRLNLLTPERVRRAALEIREGRTFCLSIPLDYPGGNQLNVRRFAPALKPTFRDGKPFVNFPIERLDARNTDIISDDAVLMFLQYSTQIDSFAHVGAWFDADGDGVDEKVYYNGYRGDIDICGPKRYDALDAGGAEHDCGEHGGARELGIEHFAVQGMQGRGVMVNLRAHCGDARVGVGYEQLMRILEADKVEVEEGDILLFYTGFSDLIMGMNKQPDMQVLDHACACLDGRDEKLLQWITDSGTAAIFADNYAVEQYPARPMEGRRPALPLHQHCLFKLGVPLGEIFWLKELADWLRANQRYRCFLTAPPLRLPGAVGSPATPIATV